jgi:hypothetical protein
MDVSVPPRAARADECFRFYDHQMIVSKTDALGTETLSVPYPKTELEAIFEDLCNEDE